MNKKIYLIVAVVLVVVGCVVMFAFSREDVAGSELLPTTGDRVAQSKTQELSVRRSLTKNEQAQMRRKAKNRKNGAKPATGAFAEWTLDDFDDADHPYSQEDKKVALELQQSLDALDEFTDEQIGKEKKPAIPAAKAARKRFLSAFAKASKSSNPSVRRACVDAGSWCGAEMIPELTPLMADPDAEVADAAVDAVQESLDDIGSASLQFETAAVYMKTFSVNEDALEMFSSTLVSAATDLVDPADDSAGAEATALANRNWVVEVLTDLVENGSGKCVDTAKGAYEEITSEEWVNAGEAQKWAADPDNYEPPDAP